MLKTFKLLGLFVLWMFTTLLAGIIPAPVLFALAGALTLLHIFTIAHAIANGTVKPYTNKEYGAAIYVHSPLFIYGILAMSMPVVTYVWLLTVPPVLFVMSALIINRTYKQGY